jgi:arginine deiminase
MKPLERKTHINTWIIIKHAPNSSVFNLDLSNTNIDFGSGFYPTEAQAEHAATIMRLRGEEVHVFHLEIPV